MAIIAVSDADTTLSVLISIVIEDLGHEAVDARRDAVLPPVAALVLEPADAGAVELAARLRALHPDLPLICVTTQAPRTTADSLGPVVTLAKPFRIRELEAALRLVLS
jgi:DNA-binding response OmpR family regulator